jgi:ribose 5-phosphate isomerase B
MRYAVAADHAGFALKAPAMSQLESLGYEVIDLGGTGTAGDDYPDFARAAGEAIASRTVDRAIVICGSGVGASIAASKMPGIRAAVCHDAWSAHQGVEHDDMNILCLGSEVVGRELALELIQIFASATFSGDERHVRRLAKVSDIERHYLRTQ